MEFGRALRRKQIILSFGRITKETSGHDLKFLHWEQKILTTSLTVPHF
jgi:hypothetical protein